MVNMMNEVKLLEDIMWASERTNRGIKSLYKELEKKNEALKELDHMKDELLNIVSHELRTPLAISQEATSLVLEEITGKINEEQKKYLQSSKDNLVRLNTIISDFLDLSKIEAGKVVLDRKMVDFKKLLIDFTETYQTVLLSKKQKLKTEFPDEDVNFWIDGNKILQVVINLLNNAHKFTPEGGWISLALSVEGKNVLCHIEDNGVGISKEDMKKLFGKFEQFNRTAGAGAKGTGLGLAITKSLVELHEGKIWAESEIGKGTHFFFTLPIKNEGEHE